MAQVRANQMQANGVYVMRTFRRKGGSNYQYDLVRFVSRTNSAKLNELTDADKYHVIIGDIPVVLVPYQGVLSRVLDGRNFRVTFQTEDTAAALGLTATPQTLDEVASAIVGIDDLPDSILAGTPMADLPEPEAPSVSAARYGLKLEGDEYVAADPVTPVEPVIPPEPVEPVAPPKSKARKPLTPEQKARKNALARARRAAAKAV